MLQFHGMDAGEERRVDVRGMASLFALLLVWIYFVAPLWTPGFPLDPDWARLINGWEAGGEAPLGSLWIWDPFFEGGLPLSGHPCAGFNAFWVQLFALPATAALRLFLTLMSLVLVVSSHAYLHGRLRLPAELAALGAATVLSSLWWRSRLLGGDVELTNMLFLPALLHLLTVPGKGLRARASLVTAAVLGIPATATGKPDWWVMLACLALLVWIHRRRPHRAVPRPKTFLVFLLLSSGLTFPRSVSLLEGLAWIRSQQAMAEESPWGRLARRHDLNRKNWVAWRHPSVVPPGWTHRHPPRPTRHSLTTMAEQLPKAILALCSLSTARRHGALLALGTAGTVWCIAPEHLVGPGIRVPPPYSGPPLFFRRRYVAFPVEFLVIVAALIGALHHVRRHPRSTALLCAAMLGFQLAGWDDAASRLFGERPPVPLPPSSAPLSSVTMDRRWEGEFHPVRSLAMRSVGLGSLGMDRWVPFPNPVEARWVLLNDRLVPNPQWPGEVRRTDGGLRRLHVLRARCNEILFRAEGEGAGSATLNLLHAPGLRCEGARVSADRGLLRLDFDEVPRGLFLLRFGPTRLERLSLVVAGFSLLASLFWLLRCRSGKGWGR